MVRICLANLGTPLSPRGYCSTRLVRVTREQTMREEEGETRLVYRATVRIQLNRSVKAQVIIREQKERRIYLALRGALLYH